MIPAAFRPRLPWRRAVDGTADTALAVAGTAVFVVMAAVLQLRSEVTAQERHLARLTADVVGGAFLAFAGWRASRDPQVERRAREAFRFLMASSLAQAVGYAMYWYLEVIERTSPSLSLSDAVFFASYPLILLGVLRFPATHESRPRLVLHTLDAATLVVAGLMALVVFALPPQLGLVARSPSDLVYLTIYPLGNALLLMAAALLWLRRPAQRQTVAILALAITVMIAADLVYSYRVARGTYQLGSPLDVAWALSTMLSALAAHWQRVEARGGASPAAAPPATRQSPLPYLACGAVLLMLLLGQPSRGRGAALLLTIGAAGAAVLVLARQWLSERENMRLAAEMGAREGEARFRALVQHASDLLLIIDADDAVRYASPAAVDALGGDGRPLVGAPLASLVHPDEVGRAARLLERARTGGRTAVRGEWRFRTAEGRDLRAEHVATNLLDEPAIEGIVLNSRDVSDRAELAEQLAFQAFHDPLTRLANRALFADRLEQALRRGERQAGEIAMLFLDLDDFKRVNDSLGHAAGDALLVQVSARVARELRDGDTLARLGGDEFAILLEGVPDDRTAVIIGERIVRALQAPFEVEGKSITVGVSVGIATTHDATTPSDLMRNADLAMYLAKARGKGACAVFEPHMYEAAAMRLDLEEDLRRALERGELSLVFQPVVGLLRPHLEGVEALLRWTHPVRGAVSPATFIPIAEEAGLVVGLERWVLQEACRQARRWLDETGQPVRVAVNISARHVHDPSLVHDVLSALEAAHLPPSLLVLEITESVLMRDASEAARVLHELVATGVTLALDDFGTGYSSLSYLQGFPIHVLKIDRSFVAPLAGPAHDPRVVRAIIALGESLDMRIVAEGVETEAQLHALRAMGCVLGQGYLFARPLTAGQVTDRLGSRSLTPSYGAPVIVPPAAGVALR